MIPTWVNQFRGAAEIPDPVLVVDFENSEFFWNGSSKTLADLTDNGDGSYDLPYANTGNWLNGEATVVLEFSNGSGVVSGTYFSWTGTNARIEFDATVQPGSLAYTPRLYHVNPGTFYRAQTQYPGQSATVRIEGRHRTVATFKSNNIPNIQADNWQNQALPRTAFDALAVPSKLTFNRKAFNGANLLTNATLHSVKIYNSRLSDTQLDVIGMDGVKSPVHLLGDSFLNEQGVKGQLELLLSPQGYIPVSQDNVGGSTITEQSQRYALSTVRADSLAYNISKWKQSTLIIMDGGFDGTSAEAITAINDILKIMPHDRWLYIEPAPSIAIGDAGRDEWDAKVADMVTFCGSNYVSTLAEAQALSDGSAEDIAEVAKGLWPLSLKTSTVDFHPNTAGRAFLADRMNTGLTTQGWV